MNMIAVQMAFMDERFCIIIYLVVVGLRYYYDLWIERQFSLKKGKIMTAYIFRCCIIMIIPIIMGFDGEANTVFPPEQNDLSVTDLKTEYFTNPLGIDDTAPRLSWKINSSQRNSLQTTYQIQVSETIDFEEDGLLWNTGKVRSDQSVHIKYQGPDLESGKRYFWRVRIWDNHGNNSGWSDSAFWEMGLLDSGDWQAQWIEPGLKEDTTKSQPSPMLRKEFNLDGEITSARAYVTSHGLYEMEINGNRVGDQVFTPGWTSYNNRLQYQTYDVTGLLKNGQNAIGVMLGDGWYRGYLGWGDQRNYYGSRLGLLAQIEITYADGSTEIVGTNDSWKVSTGPILKSDIYNGETYDARLEKTGWTTPGYDQSDWTAVNTIDDSKNNLIAPEGPPVRKIQELKPIEILTTPEGDTVVDMGQNMVGWIRLEVQGEKGTEIKLQHAEVLTKEGNFYTANLRAADQINTYILKGEGKEIWEPRFTFQGFRFVKVENYPGELTTEDLTGVVIHSDMMPTGHFETSNPLVNQLQHNIVWGQKGNFLDVPTDCPQRDERLGWTGDIQVFVQTACYNMDAAGFLSKWMGDLEADQTDDGRIPYVVPNVLGENASGASGWGDAGVIVPWALYQAYGDIKILERQYDSMKAWVEYIRRSAQDDSTTYIWNNDFTFGDWLSFNSTASDYPGAYTEKDLISTAFFARSTDLLQRTAGILGKDKDAKIYADLFNKIKEEFQREYLTSSGRIMSNTQTAYLLALQFNLYPDDKLEQGVQYLLSQIDERGHLTTGFLGTPHLNPVLSQYGHNEQAFELLLRQDYPSWLYPVTQGATTIWERWDGIKPDSTFQDEGMNSFNHYAYGAVGEWLYKTVAGIEMAAPGYKKIKIHPNPGGGFNYVRSILETMYGKIESVWEYNGDEFKVTVEVPANTEARVTLPGAAETDVKETGNGTISDSDLRTIGRNLEINLGSGRYTFTYSSEHLPPAGENSEEFLYSNGMKIGEILAEKKARHILWQHIPELYHSPWLSQVMGYTLDQAAASLPNSYHISGSTINKLKEDLEDLSTN